MWRPWAVCLPCPNLRLRRRLQLCFRVQPPILMWISRRRWKSCAEQPYKNEWPDGTHLFKDFLEVGFKDLSNCFTCLYVLRCFKSRKLESLEPDLLEDNSWRISHDSQSLSFLFPTINFLTRDQQPSIPHEVISK